MAFFKKLKERMFKSSSKLEEGLDAIVEDGGAVEAAAEVDLGAEAERLATESARLEEEAARLEREAEDA